MSIDLSGYLPEPSIMKCTFDNCPYDAVVYVTLENGCVCYPDIREMNLCMQHWIKLEPLGPTIATDLEIPSCQN